MDVANHVDPQPWRDTSPLAPRQLFQGFRHSAPLGTMLARSYLTTRSRVNNFGKQPFDVESNVPSKPNGNADSRAYESRLPKNSGGVGCSRKTILVSSS